MTNTPASSNSVRALISDADGRVLLVRRAQTSRNFAGQWEFPGGKADSGETLAQALCREAMEETGLTVEPGEWLGLVPSEIGGKHIVTEFFEARQTGGNLRLSDEHMEFSWVKPAALSEYDLVPGMRDVARSYAAQKTGDAVVAGKIRLDVRVQVYRGLRDAYEAAAEALVERLRAELLPILPQVQVEGRVKTVVSFAEKLCRKPKYSDPLRQITDLCGVRVLVGSEAEIALVGRTIRALFTVDEANSLDALTRLRADEFGYRSVHYVIRPSSGQLSGWPERLEGMAAEIQVRTWLQHAQANVDHDRVYKSPCGLPSELVREKSRLAAQLESIDAGLQRLAQDIDQYHEQLGCAVDAQCGVQERELLATLRQIDHANEAVVLRQIRLAMACASWREAAVLARDFVAALPSGVEPSVKLQSLGGLALVRSGDSPDARAEGLRWLERAAARDSLSKKPWLRLGEARELHGGGNAADAYRHAYEIDPADPEAVAGFIRTQGREIGTARLARLLAPTVRMALARCARQAESGLVLASDHFRAAWLTLLVDDAAGAWSLFLRGAQAIRYACEIDDTLGWFAVEDDEPCRRDAALMASVLRLVRHRRFPDAESVAWLNAQATLGGSAVRQPVAIIAGSCATISTTQRKEWVQLLGTVFARFDGTLISGGTRSGIAELVGEIGANAAGRIFTLGYAPATTAAGTPPELDARYGELRTTAGKGFSAQEPLQAWIDLLAAGVDPKTVTLIGLGGGDIAAIEYRLALVLGARVIVVTGTGGAADTLAADPAWLAPKANLTPLPQSLADALALEALLARQETPLSPEKLNELGELVHKAYLSENLYTELDPVRTKWPELREDLKESNRDQVSASVRILATEGYSVVPQAEAAGAAVKDFPQEELDRMAEREHARWNLERLRSGWRYGPKKDVAKKLTPCLVPWHHLTEEIKGYDRNAVRNYVTVLGKVGLAVVRRA